MQSERLMRDMFGNPVTEAEARALIARRDPMPAGYAAQPGSGPEGETCGSCAQLVRIRMAKTYLKCALTRAAWTGGRKTDVLARAPACSRWEAN